MSEKKEIQVKSYEQCQEEYAKWFVGTDFGSTDFPKIVLNGLQKIACGWANGRTLEVILLNAGLIEKRWHDYSLTDVGLAEMYALNSFEQTILVSKALAALKKQDEKIAELEAIKKGKLIWAMQSVINEQVIEITRLREALQYYAEGNHFIEYGGKNFTPDGSECVHYTEAETVSGEPQNYFEGHGDYGYEDGSIARQALAPAAQKTETQANTVEQRGSEDLSPSSSQTDLESRN